MRARSWIALLFLCMGCSTSPMQEAKVTGKSSTAVKGSQPAHINAAVGGSFTLSCSFTYTAHKHDGMFGKFYTQNGQPTTKIDPDVKCSPRISKDALLHCDLSSTITNARLENEAVYVCEVVIPSAEGTITVTGTGTAVTLYSEVGSIGILPPPRLVSGSESELTCRATGFYPRNVTVRWFCGETPAPPGDVADVITAARDGTFSLSSRYRFRAHALDHGVRCHCLVSHPTWTGAGNASLTLDVSYGPSCVNVTSRSDPVTQGVLHLPEGSPLNISCSADGNPRPETLWLGGSINLRHAGGTLQLGAVQEEDGGKYWCVASNLYGEKNASITLLVYQSKFSHRVALLCVVGTVLMTLVFVIVCILTKTMNRSQAQTLSDCSSEGAFPHQSEGASPDKLYSVLEISGKRAQQQKPAPQDVDESQLIYTEIKFPLATHNPNVTEAPGSTVEVTESPIYSTVMLKNAGGHRSAARNGQQKR
ncbi:hypothetical protein COCON_G00073700 [Conger conger]|uniref:Ig-like domain-containing protein n=1 Tax=Conger conger TaxID=82655 RepID=A0A9Q1I1X7_CONCO|nr:hemicentin-2-like [Conger conger]XP_061105796.1 hemicentin-2-like [Conger conger]KAJ8275618.1 hypothetical protein COCON_G00073700 [Conger conger]